MRVETLSAVDPGIAMSQSLDSDRVRRQTKAGSVTLAKIETYLRHVNKDENGFREDLSQGFVIYNREAGKLLDHLKRREYDCVGAMLESTLIDSWGKAALAFNEAQQSEALAAVGGSIHERGLRWASESR